MARGGPCCRLDPGDPLSRYLGGAGGGIKPGETSEEAVRRELVEEIAFVAGELAAVGRFVTPEGFALTMFAGAIDAPIEALALNEGVARRYFPSEALREARMAPWLRGVLLRYFVGTWGAMSG